MDFLLNLLMIGLPEPFLAVSFGLAVFHLSIRPYWRKLLVMSLLFGIMSTALTAAHTPVPPKFFFLYVSLCGMLYTFIKLDVGRAIGVGTAAVILLNLGESIMLMILNLLHIELDVVLQNKLYLYSLVWAYLSLIILLTAVLRMCKFNILRFFPKTKHNSYLFLLVLFAGVELLLILYMNTQFIALRGERFDRFISQHLPFILATALFLFLLMIITFRIYFKITITRVETETEIPYLQNIHDLLTAIRSMKHDAVNHYTAIDGFLKVKMYDLATDYVKQLLHEATDIIQVVEGVKNPAVSALLHSKMAICVSDRISLSITVKSEAQLEFIKTNDLIKVLGNLLDNAIHATLKEAEQNRWIRINWTESDKAQTLTIENSGPTIPAEKLQHVFDLGYTTKTTGEGGVGLAVVKSVIEKYNGTIVLYSQDSITRFSITFLK